MKVIKDLRILKVIGKMYDLDFDKTFKYYIGNAYLNNKGNNLIQKFAYKNKVYELKTHFNKLPIEAKGLVGEAVEQTGKKLIKQPKSTLLRGYVHPMIPK